MSRLKRIRAGLKSGELRLVDCRDWGETGHYWVIENVTTKREEELLMDIDPALEAVASGLTSRQWAIYHAVAPILRGRCEDKNTRWIAGILGHQDVGYEHTLCCHLKALEAAGYLKSEEDTHGPSGSVLARYWHLTDKRPFNYADRCIKIGE